MEHFSESEQHDYFLMKLRNSYYFDCTHSCMHRDKRDTHTKKHNNETYVNHHPLINEWNSELNRFNIRVHLFIMKGHVF